MLCVHFGEGDLGRTRVVARPDPIGETLLSLRVLHARGGGPAFDDWRTRVRTELATLPDAALIRLLAPLTGDLLALVGGEFDDAVRALATMAPATAAARLAAYRLPAGWAVALTGGDGGPLRRLAEVLCRYHAVAVAPYWSMVCARVDTDRALRGRALLSGGSDSLLATLSPNVCWRPPVLEIPSADDRVVRLPGTGLLLLPLAFGPDVPMLLDTVCGQPVLLFRVAARPVEHQVAGKALVKLMGRTRALLLRLAGDGATTGELARRATISESSASEHVTVLRQAGLLATSRQGKTAVHSLTQIGAALLRGTGDPVVHIAQPDHFGQNRRIGHSAPDAGTVDLAG